MPITQHMREHVEAHAMFLMRHRDEVTQLTIPGGLTCTSTRDAGYWHVTDRGNVGVYLAQMLFNWRVVAIHRDEPQFVHGGWCYFGLGFDTFTRALQAAHAWDPDTDDAPAEHDKEALPYIPPPRPGELHSKR